MKKIIFCLVAIGLFFNSFAFAQNLAVIVNEQSPIFSIKQTPELKDIKDVYLGRTKYWKGSAVKAVNQKDRDTLEKFLREVCDMSISDYQHHWVKLELDTGANAPKITATPEDIIDYVRSERTGIGYVWESQAKGAQGVRIVLLLTIN